jgi:hypothetical protein
MKNKDELPDPHIRRTTVQEVYKWGLRYASNRNAFNTSTQGWLCMRIENAFF